MSDNQNLEKNPTPLATSSLQERIASIPGGTTVTGLGFLAIELFNAYGTGWANRQSNVEGLVHSTGHLLSRAVDKLPKV